VRDAADADAARLPAGARVLEPQHLEYPAGLKDLPDPPARLFLLGTLPHAAAVAIVGSRAATPYGITFARRLAQDLARVGTPVVSGLARGIDAAAHLGALDAGGFTLAVIPSGLDCVTPRHHRALAARIAQHGAVVTEIESGGPKFLGQFVERNRLIAALAAAVVVVEAAEHSGALSTAAAARRLGRPLLAVPGDVNRPTARGCHRLLRSGAALCEEAGDVLAALAAHARGGASSTSSKSRRRVVTAQARVRVTESHAAGALALSNESGGEGRVWAALTATPQTVDHIAAQSGLAVGAVVALLTQLEWGGLVARGPGPRWRRAR